MKPKLILSAALLAPLLAATAARGQVGSLLLWADDDSARPLNRIGFSYRPGFNVTANFKNVGGYSGVSNPGPATSGADHIYDDGYNRVDSTGNAAGVTSFWGYQSASQVPGNNTIVMHSTAPTTGAVSPDSNGDPQHGFEFTYNRELGHTGRLHWGVEGAFGYTDFTIHDNSSMSAGFTRTSDTYSLLGITPPPPPYNGPHNAGPGNPVISDSPTRTVTQIAGTGSQTLDASLYSLRLGPYVEIPLAARFAFSLSGGLALMGVHSQFDFQQSAALSIPGQPVYTGSGSHSDVLAGGYVQGNFTFAITPAMDLILGGQYLSVGNYTHVENGRQAALDFRNSLFATVGVGYRF